MSGLDLKALGDEAAQFEQQSPGTYITDRKLYIDGDSLAYYCAGNDSTTVGEARARLAEKVQAFTTAAGTKDVTLLLTDNHSHKGWRYAIASVKPYQGNRKSGTKPKNWRALRDMLDTEVFGKIENYADREADDAFSMHAYAAPNLTVMAYQDKDMRMLPGYHLDWKTNRMTFVPPGTYDHVFNDLQYGLKWFWLQMLHGDPADFIPGLPKAYGKLCGPVAAEKLLLPASTNLQAAACVMDAYLSHYGQDGYRLAVTEQAALLWMRRGDALWDDCFAAGGPLDWCQGDDWAAARNEIATRIIRVKELNAQAESN